MRVDPFEEVNQKCNSGTNSEKLAGLSEFPDLLEIELTNRCNLKCRMCPTGRKELTRKRGFMKEQVFGKIVLEARKHNTPIRLIRWGEPMLHPEFWVFLGLAKSRMLTVHLNTNGYFFDDEALDLFEIFKIDSIKISIHDSSDKVRDALYRLSIIEDTFRHVSVTSDESDMDVPYRFDKKSKYTTFYEGREYPRLPNCPEVFNKLSINWDGTVSACCADYDNQMLVGDVRENTLKEIWDGQKMRDYRELVVSDSHWTLPVCANCYDLGATQ